MVCAGSVAVAGSVINWLRDNLQIIYSAHDTQTLAESVSDTAGVVFVPAFNGLFAPHWRADARGVLIGLTGLTNKAHIVRAGKLINVMCMFSRCISKAINVCAFILTYSYLYH